MEITKNHLIELIRHIDVGVSQMSDKLQAQEQEIQELRMQNQALKDSNKATLDQIKQYIKELEEIRNHYVDSNNKSK